MIDLGFVILVPIRCRLFIDKVVRSLKTHAKTSLQILVHFGRLSRLDYIIHMCKKVSRFPMFPGVSGFPETWKLT